MEKLLAPARGSYLLEVPLEVLHEESIDWLGEIEFWKDEAAFFYSLILKRTKGTPLLKTKEAKEVERHLVYVSAERLDDLRIEVSQHEKFLARLLKTDHIDERLYRKRHQEISVNMAAFEKEFREMKKKIFKLAKKRTRK